MTNSQPHSLQPYQKMTKASTYLDYSLLSLQHILLLLSFCLMIWQPDYPPIYVSFISLTLLIKIFRMRNIPKVARKIALSQIKFYTPYCLTIMECLFKYFSQSHSPSTLVNLNLYLIFIVIKNIYYSFFTHEKLTSLFEAFFASFTLVGWVAFGVYNLMNSVYIFDDQQENDYKKDLILLFLTTIIANGAMMMDLIFRPVEKILEEMEEEEEEEQHRKHGKHENHGSKQHINDSDSEKSSHSKAHNKKNQKNNKNIAKKSQQRSRYQSQVPTPINSFSRNSYHMNNPTNAQHDNNAQSSEQKYRKTYNQPTLSNRFNSKKYQKKNQQVQQMDSPSKLHRQTSRDIQLELINKNIKKN